MFMLLEIVLVIIEISCRLNMIDVIIRLLCGQFYFMVGQLRAVEAI